MDETNTLDYGEVFVQYSESPFDTQLQISLKVSLALHITPPSPLPRPPPIFDLTKLLCQ